MARKNAPRVYRWGEKEALDLLHTLARRLTVSGLGHVRWMGTHRIWVSYGSLPSSIVRVRRHPVNWSLWKMQVDGRPLPVVLVL